MAGPRFALCPPYGLVLSAPAPPHNPPPIEGLPLRILAIHAGMHDSSAAAFDDYELVAAVSEERMTRVKGAGEKVPWLAVDEGLRVGGWRRNDVDAIATTRGWFATYDYKFSLPRELWYTLRRWQGKERTHRELAVLSHRFGVTDTPQLFRADRFLKDSSFRPDTPLYFANHHARSEE